MEFRGIWGFILFFALVIISVAIWNIFTMNTRFSISKI